MKLKSIILYYLNTLKNYKIFFKIFIKKIKSKLYIKFKFEIKN